MFDYVQHLLFERGLAPHGYCLLWDPQLIWTHVVADAVIGLSYFSIPLVLGWFVTRRRDIQFGWVVWMFAAFITACGTTHFLSIVTLWVPAYGVEGLVKAATAVISLGTAVALWRLLPRALALPSPAQLQRVNDELRDRVAERDAALAQVERAGRDRARAEDMLRQAQKMEAVGQLTSGVAHDFNNLLTIVIANLDRAHRLAGDAAQARPAIEAALDGAETAARLTDQLLSFARKQPLNNAAHDLNAIVAAMGDLIVRTVGPGISLSIDTAPGLPPVFVDRNQTESAILNLVINARDAMPGGGTLAIATRPGADATSVVLSVADDGCGMTAEVLAKACDPFFTTKPLREGTGLGLSQVYGFIKQSRGDIRIDSAPGAGTTVSLHIPTIHRHGGPEA